MILDNMTLRSETFAKRVKKLIYIGLTLFITAGLFPEYTGPCAFSAVMVFYLYCTGSILHSLANGRKGSEGQIHFLFGAFMILVPYNFLVLDLNIPMDSVEAFAHYQLVSFGGMFLFAALSRLLLGQQVKAALRDAQQRLANKTFA